MKGHAHHGHDPHGSWDDQAEWYDQVVDALEPELGKVTQKLLEAVGAGAGVRLLDLACGPGHTTAAATGAGAEATGLDASEPMIDIARRRFPDSRFVVGDMLAPPGGPWDAIVCRMGAHHVDSAWLTAVFGVLRPGGRLAIGETAAVDDEARARDMKDPDEWVALLEQAGFEETRVEDSGANLSTLGSDVFKHLAHEGEEEHTPPQGPIYVISARKPIDSL